MKYQAVVIAFLLFPVIAFAQEGKICKTRFVAGLSGPELLHAGVTYRVVNASQFGLYAGIGPSWGEVWTTLSLEHRLYLGNNNDRSNQKTWFFRQGTTFFPAAVSGQQFSLNLTAGKDLILKNPKNSITIDAGVFSLPGGENSSLVLVRSLNLWPALRFEFNLGL
jgi:hypothetical protein